MGDKSNYKHYENISIMLQMLMYPFEAESTAYIVASCLGLDTSDYSFEYIASWAGKDNLSAVIAALKSIQYTADRMFLAIEKEFGCPVEKWRMGENA